LFTHLIFCERLLMIPIEILEILMAKKGSLSQREIEEGIKKTQELRPVRTPKEITSKEFIEDSDEELELE